MHKCKNVKERKHACTENALMARIAASHLKGLWMDSEFRLESVWICACTFFLILHLIFTCMALGRHPYLLSLFIQLRILELRALTKGLEVAA